MCQTARAEYNKATKMLLERMEECKEKDARLSKLTLANERLQGLCRALRSEPASADHGSNGLPDEDPAQTGCNGSVEVTSCHSEQCDVHESSAEQA